MSPTPNSPAGSEPAPARGEDTMYPGTMHWWRNRQRDTHSDAHVGCGPMHRGTWGRHDPWAERHAAPGGPGELGGGFGVRRPLRFLAFKLDLDPEQVTELARILDQLKTERAQAEV